MHGWTEEPKVFNDIQANNPYGRKASVEKRTMTVPEMGEMLGLKKTERYYLLHKNYFESSVIAGVTRVDIESFEKWYANQVRYKKVNGEEPGKELRENSYSIADLAEMLRLSETTVRDVIRQNNIETITVDSWMRVPKSAFDSWYQGQSRYRTNEDFEKDAEIEEATISMPEMARLLGVKRHKVYEILRNPEYSGILQTVIVADKKRITKESFQDFLDAQDEIALSPENTYAEVSEVGTAIKRGISAGKPTEREQKQGNG